MRQVRQAVRRIERAGYTVRIRRHGAIPAEEMAELIDDGDRWRDGGTERGFSMALGRLGDPTDDRCVPHDHPACNLRNLRDASISRWFTADFAEGYPDQVEPIVGMLAQTSPEGYAANCAAVRDADFRGEIGAITAPTLVVCGAADPVTTTEDGRFLQARIPGAELAEFRAAHLSNVQAGDAFSQRVLTFLRA